MKQNYNKKSLARLGHGKWKSALRHTLLIIGMMLMSMGVYAQTATGGLYMHKTWVPDYTTCPDGDCGHIRLETFVTGESIIVDARIPTDIVVVVDQSGSMADDFDGNSQYTTNNWGQQIPNPDFNADEVRIDALKAALTNFVASVKDDATSTGCDHKIAIVGFASSRTSYNNSRWENTNMLSTAEVVPYATGNNNCQITDAEYRDALQEVTATSIAANGRHYNAIDRIQASGGTFMQYGLEMAKNILDKRETKTFTDPQGGVHDRAQVVVFFTDGYPGGYQPTDGRWYQGTYNYTNYVQQTEANAAVTQANAIKNAGATIFSVGIYTGADPNAAFQTTSQQYNNYTYWTTGTAAANGLLHFISSDYAASEVTSWSALTTSNQNTANKFPQSKFMSANNATQLNNVFGQIAQQSGGAAIPMTAQTVVQDVISTDFVLNTAGPIGDIVAYAPKCIGKVGDSLVFENINNNGLLVVDEETGVVTGGGENKLPSSLVDYDEDTKTLQLEGFNFQEMWCGSTNDHGTTVYHGRKLVILIPIIISGNTWGDGIETNGPMSVVWPNGTTSTPIEFNIPIADVVGEVWTEVVTNQPSTFTTTTIDGETYYKIQTPEDLAWFISWVNGRKGYVVNSTVTPHPEANAILMADVDMSAHNWVPIGINTIKGETQVQTVTYNGTFDGNGHVITGLKNNAGKKYMEGDVSWVFPGMFNKVSGTVKNVFVLDADFRGQQRMSGDKYMFVHHGIIVDSLLAGGQVFNCEAAGRITCKNDDKAKNLIFGGLVGLNQGTVHSCMAMAELTGYTMGGMIGENRGNGSFYNGFTNGVYKYLGESGDNAKPVGGIAGINATDNNIKNCYVRFSRDKNEGLDDAKFGRIVGTGGAFTTTSCYSPMYAIMNNDGTMGAVPGNAPMDGSGIQYSTTCAPSLMREAHSNDNMVSDASDWPVWTSITYSNGTIVPLLNGGTPLLDKLNAGKGDGASWKRTTAGGYATSPNGGDINGDYPILEFTDFNCVASADGIRLDYAASLDEMLDRHNAGKMNVGTAMPLTETNSWYTAPEHATTYTVTASPAIYGGAINLYANDAHVTKSTSTIAKTMVYIDENVSLLQDNTTSSLDAYTGQTLKSFSTTWPGGGDDGERWHNISSSLQESKFGWTYGINEQVEHNWEPNPCEWFLNVDNDDESIIPTDARSFAVADFYCFYEPQYHWINFRRNSLSHWHMDLNDNSVSAAEPDNHAHIDYVNELGNTGNETYFIPGKGYLMAISTEYFNDHYLAAAGNKHEQFIQNRGTLNNGPVDIPVTYTAANEWTKLAGYNLLGNPYQSYLNFDEFVRINTTGDNSLWNDGDTYAQTYAMYDPSTDKYVQYKSGATENGYTGSKFINMHQGFFIQTSKNTQAHFTNGMRVIEPDDENYPGFRGEKPAYPLINFIVTDYEGNSDVAVLEINRPENDGAKKLRMGNPAGRIYFRYDNTNMAIFFRDNAEGHQTLNFAAEEDGNFTLSWERANDNFRTLTLVDNITGVKTDMLTHDHYTFEGRVDDYNTRFKIVFGEMDNNDEEPVLEHFAFFDHGNLIVNGTGHFEVVDVLGRVVYSTELTDTQNTVSLPSNVRGVCMLCFTRNNETKVQKMVIQ